MRVLEYPIGDDSERISVRAFLKKQGFPNAVNELMDKIDCNLAFKYNKDVDVMTVKMIDKETKEVLKEFPPEEMVKSMVKTKEWIGAFLDEHA